MDKNYVKPAIEVVELRPEEQIGGCGDRVGPKDELVGTNKNCVITNAIVS